MKKLLFPLLLVLSSCTWIKETAREGCDAIDTITAGVTDVGGFFGAPGNVAAGAINVLLNLGCGLLAETAAVPQNIADMVVGATDETPASDTPPDGQ